MKFIIILRVLSLFLFVYCIVAITTSWFNSIAFIDKDNLDTLKYVALAIFALTHLVEHLLKNPRKNG